MKLKIESVSKVNKTAHGKLEVMAEYFFDANKNLDRVKLEEYLWQYMSSLTLQESVKLFNAPFIGRVAQLMFEGIEEELDDFADFDGNETESEKNEALEELLEADDYPFDLRQYKVLLKAYNRLS